MTSSSQEEASLYRAENSNPSIKSSCKDMDRQRPASSYEEVLFAKHHGNIP